MDDLLRRLVAFAEGDENVRAVLLEGSRADPRGAIDEWSDYDVAFVTRSNEPYLRAEWFAGFVSQFGEVALAQTPDDPALFDDAHDPLEHYAYLTQYADGLRLDLTFETVAYVRTVTLENCPAHDATGRSYRSRPYERVALSHGVSARIGYTGGGGQRGEELRRCRAGGRSPFRGDRPVRAGSRPLAPPTPSYCRA